MIKSIKNLMFIFLCLFVVFPAYAQSQATWSNPWSNNTVSLPDGWAIIPKDAQSSENQAFTFLNDDGTSIFVSATAKTQDFQSYIAQIMQNYNLQEKSLKIQKRNNIDMAWLSFHEEGLNPHDGDTLFGQQDDIYWQIQVSNPIDNLPTTSQKLITDIFDSFVIKDNEHRSINLVQTWQNPWTYKSIDIPQWWIVQNNISQCSVKLSSYESSSICINIDKSNASAQQAAKVFAQNKKLDYQQFQSGSIHGILFYASPLSENNNLKTSYIVAQTGESLVFVTLSISDKLQADDEKQLSFLLSDIIATFVPTSFTPEEKKYDFDYDSKNTCDVTIDKLNLVGETEDKNQGSLSISTNDQRFNFQNQQAGFLWMNIAGNIANIQNITRNDNNLSIQFIDQFSIPYSVTYNNLDNDCLDKLRAFFTKADISQINLGAPKATND